jgi:hypothetical protein
VSSLLFSGYYLQRVRDARRGGIGKCRCDRVYKALRGKNAQRAAKEAVQRAYRACEDMLRARGPGSLNGANIVGCVEWGVLSEGAGGGEDGGSEYS